ncbi:putative DnaJ domain, Chaperone J-domain superfamily [Helianthus annuus]|nr:putative DnaJ domain, Chaperone J-domain superfamily [Helianthus annuus]KAJ0459897.1 putative DnaJ domain, Chaperone J-domain superfamily [Helianthus annuus]KAJ0640361.1 putative DnaJ domain, Chaperone J-domain superfamily [Helianthus annuus]KAJ0644308.1 putative DnaJ domain, Chaperone J-domain superfamily [Helianthus annuus]
MDDFGILARDFGYKPQGKSAPMKSATGDFRTRPPSSPSPFSDDRIFNDRSFTGSNPRSTPVTSDIDYDSIFNNSSSANSNTINNESRFKSTSSNLPVYDKPVYDDDIFEGLPGMKNKSMYSSAPTRFDDDIFASVNASPPKRSQHSKQSDGFDDLLGNLGRTEKVEPVKHKAGRNLGQQSDHFDDLFSGFGSGGPAASNRSDSESVPKSSNSTKATSNATDDPFVVLESTSTRTGSSQGAFIDPLKSIPKVSKSQSTNAGRSPVKSSMFDDLDPLHEFGKPAPAFSSENNNRKNDQSPSKGASSMGRSKSSTRREPTEKSSFIYPDSQSQNDFQDTQQPIFDMPPVNRATSPPSYTDSNSQAAMSPSSEENDIWLTVSEIPLFTQPTRAPPPSRPPPPIPRRSSKSERVHFASNTRTFENDSPNYAKYTQSSNPFQSPAKSHMASPLDEFENFAMGGSGTHENGENNAYEKASAEARLKAERAAVQRAQAEARERAAIDAKERAERAAREARERASAEASEKAAAEAREKAAREKAAVAKAEADARRRAERAAVDKVAAEARERAAAEARDRAAAAAAAKINQQKNDNDLESFFSSRPSSAPRPRPTSEPAPDPLFQNRRGQEGPQRTSTAGASSNMRKASSTTNIVDDLSSIFGAAPSSAQEFQDIEGETEERRRARLERQQRTQERAAKALAEKNNRDLQTQREQEERNRISETLDVEIKRWAAGKEGNLRALLSTLQYVLWPGCGWQPVSLTDLITGANVKKAYRKATLCIHPDKVQQKGANLQQKYVAEKVFDLLKEAWNKFNSEELF